MRVALVVLSVALGPLYACDGGGAGAGGDPTQPILSANGTISAAGRAVIPAYGVAGFDKSGTTVGLIVSDAAMGCAALTADYTSSHMPAAGTYMSVGLPSFAQGIAAKSLVYFMVIPAHGTDIRGGGSNAGTVEVVEATDAAVSLRVDYHDTLSDGDYVVSGTFSVVHCP